MVQYREPCFKTILAEEDSTMKRLAFASVIALGALLPLAAQAEDAAVGNAGGLKWVDAPAASGLPKGSQIAPVFGDPSKAELYSFRLKLPAGAKVAPHTHPNDESGTIL